MISVIMAGTCLQFQSYFTWKHNIMERNPVEHRIWHKFFHYVGSHCWQRAERNVLRGESFLYMYTSCSICKKCKKCNLCSICSRTHVGDGVGDGSWCRHVDDDSSWAVSLIVLLVQDANTLLVEREMSVWATRRTHKLYKICKICKLYTICKLYIPIDPQVSKLHISVFFGCFETLTGCQTPMRKIQKMQEMLYSTCGTVSIVELRAHIEHRAHSLHCCEPCRASDWSTAVEILDHRAAINSLCCSDEQDVSALQGLRQCWSYACLLLNFTGNNAHWKLGIKTCIRTVNRRPYTKSLRNPQNFLMSASFSLFSISNKKPYRMSSSRNSEFVCL